MTYCKCDRCEAQRRSGIADRYRKIAEEVKSRSLETPDIDEDLPEADPAARPEWVLTVQITDPDGAEIHANFGCDNMDKLTGFPDEVGSNIIRKLAKMMIDSLKDETTNEN